MTITLKPETERLVQQELQSGHFQSVEEMILEAVRAWPEKNRNRQTSEERREAVASMQEFVEKNRVSLGGLSVKELIHEGHRL